MRRMPARAEPEFYVGYEDVMPPGLARVIRRVTIGVVLAAVALGATFASGFRPLPASRFEFGTVRTFEGRLHARPYPTLDVEPPSGDARRDGMLLVGTGKRGAEDAVAAFDGRRVQVQGSVAERDHARLLQIVPGSLRALGPAPDAPARRVVERVTLRGEIVDSKCFLGVMNPGERKVHRDCAVRCISGGIPPALLVRDTGGGSTTILLAGRDDRPIGAAIAGWAGLPVEVSGDLVSDGRQSWLRVDPSALSRLR